MGPAVIIQDIELHSNTPPQFDVSAWSPSAAVKCFAFRLGMALVKVSAVMSSVGQ